MPIYEIQFTSKVNVPATEILNNRKPTKVSENRETFALIEAFDQPAALTTAMAKVPVPGEISNVQIRVSEKYVFISTTSIGD